MAKLMSLIIRCKCGNKIETADIPPDKPIICDKCGEDQNALTKKSDTAIAYQKDTPLPVDMVNSPPHYQSKSGLESIQVIEAFDLDFCLGNVVKYILRAGKKNDELEDLKKARWYLNRKIEQMELKNE